MEQNRPAHWELGFGAVAASTSIFCRSSSARWCNLFALRCPSVYTRGPYATSSWAQICNCLSLLRRFLISGIYKVLLKVNQICPLWSHIFDTFSYTHSKLRLKLKGHTWWKYTDNMPKF